MPGWVALSWMKRKPAREAQSMARRGSSSIAAIKGASGSCEAAGGVRAIECSISGYRMRAVMLVLCEHGRYDARVKAANSTTHSYLALCNIVYWLALTVWVAVIVAAGVAATATFTTLPDPDLGLTLQRFTDFDPAQHGRIAAGMVMEPVFTFVDLVQVAAALFVVVMLVLQLALFKVPLWSLSNMLRVACIAVAIALFAWRAFTMTPQMNADLRAYWRAAEAGQVETAMQHREAFDARHGAASATFRWSLVTLVLAVGASAVSLGPRPQPVQSSKLERPKLAL
jgi:hypothetical protein